MDSKDRTAKHKYKKMIRAHKKALRKAIKENAPWDWGHTHCLVKLLLEQMLEYYKLGYNVWAEAEEAAGIKAELEEALQYLAQYEAAWEPFQLMCKLPSESFTAQKRVEMMKTCAENETEAFEKFYSFIGKHMRRWWD